MAYRLVRKPFAWWPVVFDMVTPEGKIVEASFEMHFALLKTDEAGAYMVKAYAADEAEQKPDADRAAIWADMVKEIADDWRGLEAENGEPLPWADANLRAVMNEIGMFTRVVEAWRDCLHARKRIREGN